MDCMAELKEDCENYLSTNMNLLDNIKVTETADSEKLENLILNFLCGNLEKFNNEMDPSSASCKILKMDKASKAKLTIS